MANQR
ncbi:hypothetical protein VCHC64A1_02657A, partial [Vibrio cholerae HC-64A1]